jgi:hypothetical protein
MYLCIYCGKAFNKGRQVLGHVVGKHTGKPRLRATTIKVDHLLEWQLGYLAAFIDGEGGIQITRSKRKGRQYRLHLHPVVYFTNTNLEVITTIRNWLSAGAVVVSRSKKKKNYRDTHVLHITGIRNIMRLLKAVSPYLIVKRERAALMMQFCESRLGERGPEGRHFSQEEIRLYREIRRANLRNRGRIHAHTRIPYKGGKSKITDSQARG